MVTKLTLPSKENAVQEKVNEIIDNLGGGYSAGTGIDISNNTISVDNTVAMKTDIPTVNNATLTITQGGTTKGTFTANASSNVTIALDAGGGGSVDVDNSTITLNSSDQIQTVAVKDNRSGNAIKTWTGTRAQYDAITTKDSNTLYNITDDTDVTLTLLNTLYPVGAIYIGTMNTCPLQVLGVGMWQLVSSGVVTSLASTAAVKGNGMSLGVTDGTNNNALGYYRGNVWCFTASGGYGSNVGTTYTSGTMSTGKNIGITTDGSKSGIVTDLSSAAVTLQVNMFRRVS